MYIFICQMPHTILKWTPYWRCLKGNEVFVFEWGNDRHPINLAVDMHNFLSPTGPYKKDAGCSRKNDDNNNDDDDDSNSHAAAGAQNSVSVSVQLGAVIDSGSTTRKVSLLTFCQRRILQYFIEFLLCKNIIVIFQQRRRRTHWLNKQLLLAMFLRMWPMKRCKVTEFVELFWK